ncbi:MAG: hypothetical protein RLZZ338_3711, partial [Cyanobacteriota bacterium]
PDQPSPAHREIPLIINIGMGAGFSKEEARSKSVGCVEPRSPGVRVAQNPRF